MPMLPAARSIEDSTAGPPTAIEQTRGLVGPNAIIQTAAALAALLGTDAQRTVFRQAGLSRYLEVMPSHMVAQGEAIRLFAAVYSSLPRQDAQRVMRHAGTLTARYILANRIPAPAKRLLRALPDTLAARLLISAIGRSAWTFAGSGVFRCTRGRRLSITIANNPLATPGCPWHLAVFQELFRDLVSDTVSVCHTACCADGDAVCSSEIDLSSNRCPGTNVDGIITKDTR